VPSVKPGDRDRGLRVVGVVTSAVTALSLIGIGATTALAAGATRHRDALRAAEAGTAPRVLVPGAPEPVAATPSSGPDPASTARGRSSGRADRSTRKPPSTGPTGPTGPTRSSDSGRSAGSDASDEAARPTAKPTIKPRRPKPAATTAAAASKPPVVPSTGS
jgi:hypothetical protein